jgi:hypothetical protein
MMGHEETLTPKRVAKERLSFFAPIDSAADRKSSTVTMFLFFNKDSSPGENEIG